MSKNWLKLFRLIEFFKGQQDKDWRVATKNMGPTRVPRPASRLLDLLKGPKKS